MASPPPWFGRSFLEKCPVASSESCLVVPFSSPVFFLKGFSSLLFRHRGVFRPHCRCLVSEHIHKARPCLCQAEFAAAARYGDTVTRGARHASRERECVHAARVFRYCPKNYLLLLPYPVIVTVCSTWQYMPSAPGETLLGPCQPLGVTSLS